MSKFIAIMAAAAFAGATYVLVSLMTGLSPELIRAAMPDQSSATPPVQVNGVN